LATDEQGESDVQLIDYDIYFGNKLLRSNSKPVVLDRLGSVHAWIDSQNSVQKTSYYPFGAEPQLTKNNRRKFGTYIRDDFSQLDYAQQRYYSSALGRFITPDPYEKSAQLGNPDSWNRYAYVLNNPVNFTDPQGLSGTQDQIACQQYLVLMSIGDGIISALSSMMNISGKPQGTDLLNSIASMVSNLVNGSAVGTGVTAQIGTWATAIAGILSTPEIATALGVAVSEGFLPVVGWLGLTYLGAKAVYNGVSFYNQNIGGCYN